ncbi:hypothetical protein BH23PSE2_BH23PSE2_07930 [soil metagenome]
MKAGFDEIIARHSVFAWIGLATGLLLVVPLVAMQFTNEVNWGPEDFIVMGVLLFATASLFVLVARKLARKYLPAAGVLFAAAFFFLWAELAVGILTRWGS